MNKTESGYAKLKILVYKEGLDSYFKSQHLNKEDARISDFEVSVMTGIIYIPIEYYDHIYIKDFERNKKLFKYLDTILGIDSDTYRKYAFLQLEFLAELPRGKKALNFYIGRHGESRLKDSLATVKPYDGGWRDKLAIIGNADEFNKIFGGKSNGDV